MAGIWGKNRLIEVDAMTVQKTTLVVDGQFNSRVQKGQNGFLREDAAHCIYFPTLEHTITLPEGQGIPCEYAKIYCPRHYSVWY